MTEAAILLVDDDRGIRHTMRQILGPRYAYTTAENPYEAERAFKHREFDLVMLDLNMPGGSGLDILPNLRRSCPETEVIIVTGHGNYAAALEAFRYRVAGFIEKDFSPTELRDIVDQTLRSRRQRRLMASVRSEIQEAGTEVTRRFSQLMEAGDSAPTRSDLAFFRTLADVLESQDYVTAGHSLRVSRCAVTLARRVQLPAGVSVQQVELAGYLHDLGKVGVNKSVLNKEGKFEKDDRDQVERHPVLGVNILKPLGFDLTVLDAVRHHHERLDGSGYPDGLGGEDVKFLPRLIAVVDSFDAMAWPRLYRMEPFAPEKAVEILRAEAPQKYDPLLVEVLADAIADGAMELREDPIQARVRKGPGQLGASTDGEESLDGIDDTVVDARHRFGNPGPAEPPVPVSALEENLDQLLADPKVARARFGALPDLFANPESASAPVIPIIAVPGGGSEFVDPRSGRPVRLSPEGWSELYRLISEHALRPMWGDPEAASIRLSADLPLEGRPRPDAGLQEFSDGEHIYVASIWRDPGGPIEYALRPGHLQRTVTRVAHTLDRLRDRNYVGDDYLLHRAHAHLTAHPECLPAVQTWLDDNRLAFAKTPPSRCHLTSRSGTEFHVLDNRQQVSLGQRVAELGPILSVFMEHQGRDDAGVVQVELEYRRCDVETHLWTHAQKRELTQLPTFTKAMHESVLRLRRKGLRTFADAVQKAHLEEETGDILLRFTELQTRLWSFDCPYDALRSGAAISEILGREARANRGVFRGCPIAGVRISDVPVPSARAHSHLVDLLGGLDDQQRLDVFLRTIMDAPETEPGALATGLDDLATVCASAHNNFISSGVKHLVGVIAAVFPDQVDARFTSHLELNDIDLTVPGWDRPSGVLLWSCLDHYRWSELNPEAVESDASQTLGRYSQIACTVASGYAHGGYPVWSLAAQPRSDLKDVETASVAEVVDALCNLNREALARVRSAFGSLRAHYHDVAADPAVSVDLRQQASRTTRLIDFTRHLMGLYATDIVALSAVRTWEEEQAVVRCSYQRAAVPPGTGASAWLLAEPPSAQMPVLSGRKDTPVAADGDEVQREDDSVSGSLRTPPEECVDPVQQRHPSVGVQASRALDEATGSAWVEAAMNESLQTADNRSEVDSVRIPAPRVRKLGDHGFLAERPELYLQTTIELGDPVVMSIRSTREDSRKQDFALDLDALESPQLVEFEVDGEPVHRFVVLRRERS